ncbi:hypothetical protein D0869_01601 [Hortaea werneckii]|uniref:Uncharacterized protein n=1 Tax=Hortaea werneckii TaxID=91943 RepID=A0A3M6YJW6_HORWE|nr:hypothetical protein D0869_01601 [Hortaea werneckii]RMY03051.1 hypothetical protein D0867_10829 [Hortaea werneckii]RMY36629.1 hypothetical protein D0866_03799 [Hortaea werneckii]
MVRLKHRYLLVNILYPDPKTTNVRIATETADQNAPYSLQFRQPSSQQLNIKILLRIIRDGVAELFGDYGSGKVAGTLQIKYFSPATSTAIIRVSRDHYRLVWAALGFCTFLPKPAEEEAIRRARISIKRAQRAVKGSATSAIETGAVAGATEDDEDVSMINGIEDHDEVEDE